MDRGYNKNCIWHHGSWSDELIFGCFVSLNDGPYMLL